MHIEPGMLVQAKIVVANVAASGILLAYAKDFIKQPEDIFRAVLSALFFTFFMQSFHMPVGPSELHFVGAIFIYLTLGFIPAMFGFSVGLLFQGLMFNPMDISHLAVNSLSLIVPLIAVHFTLGRKIRAMGTDVSWQKILKIDAMYYTGVTFMVGFWLTYSELTTPFSAWAAFASSYLVIVAIEPTLTFAMLRFLKIHQDKKIISTCFSINGLKLVK